METIKRKDRRKKKSRSPARRRQAAVAAKKEPLPTPNVNDTPSNQQQQEEEKKPSPETFRQTRAHPQPDTAGEDSDKSSSIRPGAFSVRGLLRWSGNRSQTSAAISEASDKPPETPPSHRDVYSATNNQSSPGLPPQPPLHNGLDPSLPMADFVAENAETIVVAQNVHKDNFRKYMTLAAIALVLLVVVIIAVSVPLARRHSEDGGDPLCVLSNPSVAVTTSQPTLASRFSALRLMVLLSSMTSTRTP